MTNVLIKRNLVIYHYFETDASYRDNLLHFLLFGVLPELDYIFVMSGNHFVQLPELPNVRYYFTAPQKSDFGGYAQLINEGLNLDTYANIFFINSSVRGPFIPPHHQQAWYEAFLEQMQGDVGMAGISICILKEDFRHSINYQARYGGSPPYSHVQTMAYVLRKEVLAKLVDDGFYREDRDATKTLAIEDYEIHLSQLVIEQGWNLRCLLPEFNSIDYRLPHINPNPTSTVGDPNEVLGYFGRSVHPYETIFVKTNRDLYTEAYLDRLAYSMLLDAHSHISEVILASPSIQGYIQKVARQALSDQAVLDFAYLPGFIENQALLKEALLEAATAKTQLSNMLQSTSWKITAPIRALKDWFK
jgi:hypothetical protein